METEFPNGATARKFYLQELISIAAKHNSSVRSLAIFIDKKNVWSEEDRYFMRCLKLAGTVSNEEKTE